MSFIYVIENDINDKKYIGYTSQTLHRRFYQHCYDAINSNNDNSILHAAIKKYGEQHFYISVVEEFDESEKDWCSLEKAYILQYNSLTPNGYNIQEGGDKPPVHYGEKNNKAKLTQKEVEQIYILLQQSTTPMNKIAELYDISTSQLGLINQGESWFKEGINYPIRVFNEFEIRALEIFELLKEGKTNKEIGLRYGMKPNTIASINTGKLYSYLYDGDYPIRKERQPQTIAQRKTAERVKYFIEGNKNASTQSIAAYFNLSEYIIRKIIKGQSPYHLDNTLYPLKHF